MTLQEYARPYTHSHGGTTLEYCAIDDNDTTFEVSIGLETGLQNAPLDNLIQIISEQFNKRYQHTDSRFFHVESFTRVVNAAYENQQQNGLRCPIYDCSACRNLAADDLESSYNHLFTVEMDIEKREGTPVAIYCEWRFNDRRPNKEELITSAINPAGVTWNPHISKFVDHAEADLYNRNVEEYLLSIKASVCETLQGELAAIALARAEHNWERQQQLGR